jgi:hypothetical protein
MNIKQLEKATRIIEQVKALDKEIIDIDRQALLVANGEVKIELNIDVTDLAKKREEEEAVKFDEDGSLLSGEEFKGILRYAVTFHMGRPKDEKKKKGYGAEISETAALQIFGILLYEKQTRRTQLLQKLERIGVDL